MVLPIISPMFSSEWLSLVCPWVNHVVYPDQIFSCGTWTLGFGHDLWILHQIKCFSTTGRTADVQLQSVPAAKLLLKKTNVVMKKIKTKRVKCWTFTCQVNRDWSCWTSRSFFIKLKVLMSSTPWPRGPVQDGFKCVSMKNIFSPWLNMKDIFTHLLMSIFYNFYHQTSKY